LESPLVPEEVRAAVRQRGLRFHLIRRYRQREPRTVRARTSMTCLMTSASGDRTFVRSGVLTDARELLDAGLDTLASGAEPAWGAAIEASVFLVCTHGKADVCCARNGRPVARELARLAGDRVWETTHVGGCRFAANVVCLPSGLYYGRVQPGDVASLVAAADSGRVAGPWFRGRAGRTRAVQVAEVHLRRMTGTSHVDAVTYGGHRRLDADTDEVTLLTGGTRYRLVVRHELLAPRPLTCAHDRQETPVGYRVIEVITS
jgi:hypothetical protein